MIWYPGLGTFELVPSFATPELVLHVTDGDRLVTPAPESPLNLPISRSETTNLPIEQTVVDLDPSEPKGARAGSAGLDGSVSVPICPAVCKSSESGSGRHPPARISAFVGAFSGVETPSIHPLKTDSSRDILTKMRAHNLRFSADL